MVLTNDEENSSKVDDDKPIPVIIPPVGTDSNGLFIDAVGL